VVDAFGLDKTILIRFNPNNVRQSAAADREVELRVEVQPRNDIIARPSQRSNSSAGSKRGVLGEVVGPGGSVSEVGILPSMFDWSGATSQAVSDSHQHDAQMLHVATAATAVQCWQHQRQCRPGF